MIENANFYGAWILPNGDIHWTNNILSHSKVIDELNIRSYLEQIRNSLQFSQMELDRHFNCDLSYIALKIGYIRITSFYNQLGIQFENSMNDIRYIAHKDALINVSSILIKKMASFQQCIIIEQLSNVKNYISFNSYYDFLNYLKS